MPQSPRSFLILPALLLALTTLSYSAAVAGAEDKPVDRGPFEYQVTGLFSADRVADLQATFEKKIPEIKLVSCNYDSDKIVVEFDRVQLFGGERPERIVLRVDELLRERSRNTFGVKPLSNVPSDQLTSVEIPVVGLDCKGCSLALYESVYKLPGVERAKASFKEGRLVAWISAETSREKLEAVLKERGVTLKTASETPPK